MIAPATIDFDDAEGLLAADRGGLLRGASMAGAQVRAIAAALEEGALETVGGDPPRTLIWLAGRGDAETAGSLLAAALGGTGCGAHDRRLRRCAALDRRTGRARRRGR